MREWNEARGKAVFNKITNNNHIVRFVFEEMYKQKIHQRDMAERMGFHRDTMRSWRQKHMPSIQAIQDCLGYLGYELKIVKKARKGSSDE